LKAPSDKHGEKKSRRRFWPTLLVVGPVSALIVAGSCMLWSRASDRQLRSSLRTRPFKAQLYQGRPGELDADFMTYTVGKYRVIDLADLRVVIPIAPGRSFKMRRKGKGFSTSTGGLGVTGKITITSSSPNPNYACCGGSTDRESISAKYTAGTLKITINGKTYIELDRGTWRTQGGDIKLGEGPNVVFLRADGSVDKRE
jgi:hypothetical protein